MEYLTHRSIKETKINQHFTQTMNRLKLAKEESAKNLELHKNLVGIKLQKNFIMKFNVI